MTIYVTERVLHTRPRFLVDAMLGDLVRWLWLLGLDAVYSGVSSDDEILEKLEREGRVLITRDEELWQRALQRRLPAILQLGEDLREILAVLSLLYGLDLTLDPDRARCGRCGAPVVEVSRLVVLDLVPPSTLRRFRRYWLCTRCGAVYWVGSHYRNITRFLEETRLMVPRVKYYVV